MSVSIVSEQGAHSFDSLFGVSEEYKYLQNSQAVQNIAMHAHFANMLALLISLKPSLLKYQFGKIPAQIETRKESGFKGWLLKNFESTDVESQRIWGAFLHFW